MILKELLPQSCYGSIATITGEESIEKVKFFIDINQAFIESFPHVIISLNTVPGVTSDIILDYSKEWLKIAPNAIILHSNENRGHMFGTIDLEEAILAYIKENLHDTRYLFKSMEDVITDVGMLYLDLPEAGFYYLPSISYESLVKKQSFPPQTTFFIIDIANIDTLYGYDVEYKILEYFKEREIHPGLKPWDMSYDIKFDCETHLARTVQYITKKCILNDDSYSKLLNFVQQYRVADPSHKNIYFIKEGICHYHLWQDTVFEL